MLSRAPLRGSPCFPALCREIQRTKAGTLAGAVAATTRSPPCASARAGLTRIMLMAPQQRAIFPRDTGLQIRMLVTLFLLGLLYVALIGALLAAGTGLILMVLIIGGLSFAQLFFSDKLALAAMGAKEVSPEEAPGLHGMIERLCIQADLPKPRVAVAERARGRDGARAVTREAPRRADHDHRQLLRLDRRADHAVRLLLRRRRRREPQHPGCPACLVRGL